MISKRTKMWLLLFILAISSFFFYKLWDIQNRLPMITQIEDVQLESVLSEEYTFDNNKIKIVSFIFTNCPDICPMTMVDMNRIQAILKENKLYGEQVEIVTITLDPEVDTKEVLQKYASNFNVDPKGWHILRGTVSQTKEVAAQFQMLYKKEESGFVTHSTNMYVVDQGNNIRSIHDMAVGGKQVNIDEILENINRLLEG
ncbi:SCO family protein [Bacillus sp. JJ1562]|uniref:SCO family protein n=1 Tax=Bacillus sp. JJ1562 TaxID=3122960 RepID=UPI003001FED1